MTDERDLANELDGLRAQVGHIVREQQQRQREDHEDRLAPHRMGLTPGPEPPRVGAGPYEPAITYAPRSIVTGALSPRAWFRGPNDMDIDITYVTAGKPSTVTRQDSAVTIFTATINYAADHIASVVVLRDGETVTITPTYNGDDITHLDRVIT